MEMADPSSSRSLEVGVTIPAGKGAAAASSFPLKEVSGVPIKALSGVATLLFVEEEDEEEDGGRREAALVLVACCFLGGIVARAGELSLCVDDEVDEE